MALDAGSEGVVHPIKFQRRDGGVWLATVCDSRSQFVVMAAQAATQLVPTYAERASGDGFALDAIDDFKIIS